MSKGLGHIEQAIARAFEECEGRPELAGRGIWVGYRCIARLAYGTMNPTNAQRVAIRRAKHSFVRKHHDCELDGGWGRTQLFVVGVAGHQPKLRAHPLADADHIPVDLSTVR